MPFAEKSNWYQLEIAGYFVQSAVSIMTWPLQSELLIKYATSIVSYKCCSSELPLLLFYSVWLLRLIMKNNTSSCGPWCKNAWQGLTSLEIPTRFLNIVIFCNHTCCNVMWPLQVLTKFDTIHIQYAGFCVKFGDATLFFTNIECTDLWEGVATFFTYFSTWGTWTPIPLPHPLPDIDLDTRIY